MRISFHLHVSSRLEQTELSARCACHVSHGLRLELLAVPTWDVALHELPPGVAQLSFSRLNIYPHSLFLLGLIIPVVQRQLKSFMEEQELRVYLVAVSGPMTCTKVTNMQTTQMEFLPTLLPTRVQGKSAGKSDTGPNNKRLTSATSTASSLPLLLQIPELLMRCCYKFGLL